MERFCFWLRAGRPVPQDMFSRMMVGWAIDDNMRTELEIKALQKAINHRQLPKGMIVHSDGGSQYASKEFRTLLKKYDLTQSMTRKNNHRAGSSLR